MEKNSKLMCIACTISGTVGFISGFLFRHFVVKTSVPPITINVNED